MAVEFDDIDFFDEIEDDNDNKAKKSLSASRKVESSNAFEFDEGASDSNGSKPPLLTWVTALIAVGSLVFGLIVGSIVFSSAPTEAQDEQVASSSQEVSIVTTKPVLDQVRDIKDSEIEMLQRQLSEAKSRDAGDDLFVINDANRAALNVVSPFLKRVIQLKKDAPAEDLTVARTDVLGLCDYNSMAESGDLDSLLTGHGVEGALNSEVELAGAPLVTLAAYTPEVELNRSASSVSYRLSLLSKSFIAYVPVATESSTHLAIYAFTLGADNKITAVSYIGCTSGAADDSAVAIASTIAESLEKSAADREAAEAEVAAASGADVGADGAGDMDSTDTGA